MNIQNGQIFAAGMTIPNHHFCGPCVKQPIYGRIDFTGEQFARLFEARALKRKALELRIEDASHTLHVRDHENRLGLGHLSASREHCPKDQGK